MALNNVGDALVGSYGTLTLNADGSYIYVADHTVPSNIIAQDIFTYTASDGDGGTATSSLTITITQAGQTYIAGTPGQALKSGNGSVFLDGSLLQDQTITAGNGNDAALAGSNDTINLGNGNDTVTAGATSIITVGSGNDNVTAESDSTIKLGNGNDTVYVGQNDTITVGTGHDSFIFQQTTPGNIGAVTVVGFNPNKDSFTFSNQLTTSVSYHDNAQGNAVITVDSNPADTITLVGVHATALHPSDFHFADPAAIVADAHLAATAAAHSFLL
jgi:VCBS repeat-containing protein